MNDKVDKYDGEEVFVGPRTLLDAGFRNKFQGLVNRRTIPGDALRLILQGSFFERRSTAEEDSSLKQIIPYCCLMRRTEKDEFFCYKRTKLVGEERLSGKRSIGIGGHINPEDRSNSLSERRGNPQELLLNALRRELSEEVEYEGSLYVHIPQWFINDDWDAVGRVHFGVVFIVALSNPDSVKLKDPALVEGQWMTIEQLWQSRDQLERWSQLLVTGLRW